MSVLRDIKNMSLRHHCRPPGCPQRSLPFCLSPLRLHLLKALLPHVPSVMLHCCFLECHQFREQWSLRTCESVQSSPAWCRVPPPAPRPQCQHVFLGVRLRGLKVKVTFPVWQLLTLFYFILFLNPMGRGAWQAAVHGVTESDTTEQKHEGIYKLDNWWWWFSC